MHLLPLSPSLTKLDLPPLRYFSYLIFRNYHACSHQHLTTNIQNLDESDTNLHNSLIDQFVSTFQAFIVKRLDPPPQLILLFRIKAQRTHPPQKQCTHQRKFPTSDPSLLKELLLFHVSTFLKEPEMISLFFKMNRVAVQLVTYSYYLQNLLIALLLLILL